jgi:hypothetical protein
LLGREHFEPREQARWASNGDTTTRRLKVPTSSLPRSPQPPKPQRRRRTAQPAQHAAPIPKRSRQIRPAAKLQLPPTPQLVGLVTHLTSQQVAQT